MKNILIVGEIVNGEVGSQTWELLSAARELGGEISLAFAAHNVKAALHTFGIEGIKKTLVIELPTEHFNASVQCSAVESFIKLMTPDIILMPFSIKSTSFAGALAAANNFAFAADIIGVTSGNSGDIKVLRAVYGGSVVAEIEFITKDPILLLLRSNKWVAAQHDGNFSVDIECVEFSPSPTNAIEHIEDIKPQGDIGLKRADVIFSIGRGIGNIENIEIFKQITDKLGIPLGASRPIIDSGWLPRAHQVGQTGETVAPKLYVTFGISGALHHLAGMSGSKTIVAINTDAEAPIFSVAHYGAQADLLDVAGEILKLV